TSVGPFLKFIHSDGANCSRGASAASIEPVTVDSALVKNVEQQIESCEHCPAVDAEIPFDWLLAEVNGRRGAV
ncbi:MAG TPA: hypothetical protein VKK06_21225, partial [Terriglobia bacterium]|nr:hypothetical protein [Terriglobia bacterium]